jgi:hypothetical protein
MDDVAWLIRVQVLVGMLLQAMESAPPGNGLPDGDEREQVVTTLQAIKRSVDRRLAELTPEAESSV